MANEDHIEILKRGPRLWNAWRKKHPNLVPDLSFANLGNISFESKHINGKTVGFNLRDTNLSHSILVNTYINNADLSAANLSNANIVSASFFATNLFRADLTKASIGGVSFHLCDLREAVFSECSADYTNFADALLDDAVFDGGLFAGTLFPSNDLSSTIGLETIEPSLPCVIGLETIFLSKGKIPESFLLACGATDSLISYIPSLVDSMDGIQFYSCFISYSSKDDAFVRRLHSRLRDEHLRVWFAPEDLKGGQKSYEQIDEAIRIFDKLLVVLSENSLQSEWVMTEIRRARRRERESGKRKLFPIRLVSLEALRTWQCFDSDSGEDLAIEVREYHIPDFSAWEKNAKFESAFSRLLSDLKSE